MEDNKIITAEEIERLFVTGKINKSLTIILDDTDKYEIEGFVNYCISNFIDGKEFTFQYSERSIIYYYLEEPDLILVQKIKDEVSDLFKKIREVKNKGLEYILENHEDWFKKNKDVVPQLYELREFFYHLVNSESNIFNTEYLKIYLVAYIFFKESEIILHSKSSPIEPKEKSITEKSIYDLPEDFEMEDFDQALTWNDDAQFNVPRILDEGEVCFWVYNNIAGLKEIRDESFICETEDDCGHEEDGFMFNRTGEGIEKEPDGTEYTFRTWLRISDKKYTDFINEPIYNSFHDTYRTGLEIARGKQFEGWNFGKFALNILFCDFVEPQEKGADTYYKIVPKHSGVPDLQFFVEEELKFIAEEYSYVPLDTIPHFFKYHFEKSENVIEFLRHAIKTTNNAWGMTALSILCKKTFNEWLEHIIKEYGLNREEIFRQPTTSATVEESKKVNIGNSEHKKPSIRAIALYYYFLITKGIELSFDNREVGVTKAMIEVTDDWKIDNRTFREEWGIVNEPKTRKNTKFIKDYRQAIQLLEKNIRKNNDAIALAKSELRILAPLR
jgi:hypothetical protein